MKRKTFYLIILVCVIILIITFIGIYRARTIDYEEIPITLSVGDYLGFNIDSDALHFGTVMPSGHGYRNMNVHNKKEIRCKVFLEADGPITEWITFSPEDTFYLDGDETETIQVNVTVPPGTEFGNYSGIKVKTYFYKG